MKHFFIISCFTSFILLFACGDTTISDLEDNHQQKDSLSTIIREETKIIEPVIDDEIVVLKENGITLTEIKTENNTQAALGLTTKQFKEGKNTLQFSVDGMEDYAISIVENNYTVSQHSSTTIEKEFFYGNNVFLAFLTNNRGISIKTNKANVLQNVTFNNENLFDTRQSHLFYYLPTDKQPVLDFYLVNTSISETRNKVKVMINEVEFILTKWAAYQITGLEREQNTIRIQLINEKGKLIEGPFNDSGDRVFKVDLTL